MRVFSIYRCDPDDGDNPRVDTYELDMDGCGPMVLDALIKIKNEIDPTLTFRRSCREGICGSCAMNIDGTQHTGLHQRLRRREAATVRIYPLPHMPVIKDLVPDLTNFYAQYASVKPWLQTRTPPPPDGERLQSQGGAAQGGPACRRASCASAARPPARATGGTATATSALPRCWPRIAGSSTAATRPPASASTQLEDPFRLYRCHTIMNCTEACPKDLNPAKAIGEIKQMIAQRGSLRVAPDDAAAAVPGRLRWRCRRGMRELDELLTQYLTEQYPGAPPAEQAAFAALLEAQDADIHAWCLLLCEPPDPLLRALVGRITTRSSAGT